MGYRDVKIGERKIQSMICFGDMEVVCVKYDEDKRNETMSV
jgi:hypothetical protein